MAELKRISVVIPCYNEQKFIMPLIESMLAQDYPRNQVEIIFADGMSEDGTRDLIRTYSEKFPFIKCIDNEGRYVPSALNKAILSSSGEIIIRMDAHSIYPDNYWRVLVEKLLFYNAENVGGVWDTQPGSDSVESKAIVLATSHPLGIGNAGYRLGGLHDKDVDTVPFGCFHRSIFDKVGFFDEDLIRNQDDEFNGRIRKSGGRIVLIPSLRIKYFARANFEKLSDMFFQYGLYKPLVNVKLGSPATLRQFAPPLLVFSLSLLAVLSIVSRFFFLLFVIECTFYAMALIVVSARLTIGAGFSLFVKTMCAFPVIHFSYGIGYIFGLYRYTIRKAHLHRSHNQVKSSR